MRADFYFNQTQKKTCDPHSVKCFGKDQWWRLKMYNSVSYTPYN